MPSAQGTGARIRRARKLLGLTQQELASMIGVSRNTVDSWENGRTYPKRYDVAIEQALGISLEEPERSPLADLEPFDDWEREVAGRQSISEDDKVWLITWSRAERAEAVRLRRERRAAEAAGQDPSGRHTQAG